jgi:glucose-1-phosphate thymidylyltransferase
MLAAEHSLHAMRDAHVRRCVMVISDRKPEMLRYFGSGEDNGLSLAYLVQPEPLGLAAAVDAAFEWTEDYNVCLALPDTVFMPRDALGPVTENLLRRGMDLALGVFPTASPQHLGPVRIGDGDRVLEVLEKPSQTDLRNTWGVAAWTPRFSAFLHRSRELHGLSIGHVFQDAVRQGLKVCAVTFDCGSYTDVGTGESFAAMVVGSQSNGNGWQKALVSSTGCGSLG